MSDWRQLLSRTLHGLAALRQNGQPIPWTLGGGTALMLAANHRLSKDIDAFIDDPQYLAVLSPDVTDVWNCQSWDRAAHYLKLRYPEGEIDFIVTSSISDLPSTKHMIDLPDRSIGTTIDVDVDPPVEIALKKIHYRASMLKPRDVFDIAEINKLDHQQLIAHLVDVTDKKNDLLHRLDSIDPCFLQAEIAELDILPGWESEQALCLSTVKSIAKLIPDR